MASEHAVREPLCSWTARAHWLQAAAAVALGAAPSEDAHASRSKEAATIAAVLFDDRIAALGARENKPLSCASVYANLVARFRGGIAGRESRRCVPLQKLPPHSQMAFTHDMRSVIAVTDGWYGDVEDTLFELDARSGALISTAVIVYEDDWKSGSDGGDEGDDKDGDDDNDDGDNDDGDNEPSRRRSMDWVPFLTQITDLFVAEDGFIFASSYDSNRVHVFTPFPDAKLHDYVGGNNHSDYIWRASSVCATADFVFVSGGAWIYRFSRHDLSAPRIKFELDEKVYDAECVRLRPLHDDKRIAILMVIGIEIRCAVDFGVAGRFIAYDFNSRWPFVFACSAFDEFIVMSDEGSHAEITVLEPDGTLFKTVYMETVYVDGAARKVVWPDAVACSRAAAVLYKNIIVFWG